jgi:hypothetical protein
MGKLLLRCDLMAFFVPIQEVISFHIYTQKHSSIKIPNLFPPPRLGQLRIVSGVWEAGLTSIPTEVIAIS